MTKEKLNDLIERANKYIGKTIPVKKGENTSENKNPFIDHIFTKIGNIVMTRISDETEAYFVNGIVESTLDKSVVSISLFDIVNHFESHI